MTVFLDHDGAPVLRRHLLPARAAARHAVVRPAAHRGERHLDGRPRAPHRGRGPDHRRARRCGRRWVPPTRSTPRSSRSAARLRRRPRWRRSTTASAAASATRRSSRRRWSSRRCCAITRAPVTRVRSRWSRAPARRWRAAACTTSSPAASRATPSTPTGSCRTSRRCSTTTRCCCASTCTGGVPPATPSPSASRVRRPHSCCATCDPRRAASSPRSTPTPRATRAGPTSGPRSSSSTASARTTARGRRTCSRSPPPARSSTARPSCSCTATRSTQAGGTAYAGACSTPADGACSRGATTRSWPRGTASRSPPSPRPAPLLDEPTWVDAAADAAALVDELHRDGDGRLLRTSRDGRAGRNAGVLEDLACVAEGFLALHQVSGEDRWLDAAGALLDDVLDRFRDTATGGFFDTAVDAERLVLRPQDPTDNASPSGWSAASGALLTYAALTGSDRHRAAAEESLAALVPLVAQHPRFAGWGAGGRRGVARRSARGRGRRRAAGPGHRGTASHGAARHGSRRGGGRGRTRRRAPAARGPRARRGTCRRRTSAGTSCATCPLTDPGATLGGCRRSGLASALSGHRWRNDVMM